MRILVVDDDSDLRDVVSYILRRKGHAVTTAADGLAALEVIETAPPELVILDISMPKLDGLETCRRIRESSTVPIIMLTVRGSESDIVRSLALGADDHITKPFNHQELLARVEAVARRSYGPGQRSTSQVQPALERGGIAMDPNRYQITRDGQPLNLTPLEFKLLYYLMINEDQVLSPAAILEHVWGFENESNDEVVKVNISRLRGKLEPNRAQPCFIHTIPGVGYSFRLPSFS